MLQTFLAKQNKRLGALMVDFHGWELPLRYAGILAEHKQCREATALFDTGHMGMLRVEGVNAGADLSRLLTCDAAGMPVGKCGYGLILNTHGCILDDVIAMRIDKHLYLLVVNAATSRRDTEWISVNLSADTLVLDIGREWGKLDVQGPSSYRALAGLFDFDPAELAFFAVRCGRYAGVDAIISRTGYTGELGYEIFMPGEALADLYGRLLDIEGVAPAGLGARDLLRLEMCYPLYGSDIDDRCNPLEAGLDRFASMKRDFIGAESLRRLASAPIEKKLVAFECKTRRRPEPGSAIVCGPGTVGMVTSGAFSPSLGAAVGLGYVAAGLANAGTSIEIVTTRQRLHAMVAEKPLYKRGSCRRNTKELKT